jgi:hypothetical protein
MTSRDLSAFPACGMVQQKGLLLMLLAFLAGSRYCLQRAGIADNPVPAKTQRDR